MYTRCFRKNFLSLLMLLFLPLFGFVGPLMPVFNWFLWLMLLSSNRTFELRAFFLLIFFFFFLSSKHLVFQHDVQVCVFSLICYSIFNIIRVFGAKWFVVCECVSHFLVRLLAYVSRYNRSQMVWQPLNRNVVVNVNALCVVVTLIFVALLFFFFLKRKFCYFNIVNI